MKELRNMLDEKWEKRFGEEFRNLETQNKKIVFPESRAAFNVVYLQHLEGYKKYPVEDQYGKERCFMCENSDENNLSEGTAKFKHLNIWMSLKFAAPSHYLIFDPHGHRENMTENDILALHQFVKETGFSTFGNFRNSGATIPKHIHYQSLKIIFPITQSKPEYVYSASGIKVEKLKYPIAAFRLISDSTEGIRTIAQAIPYLPKPYNVLFYGDEIYITIRTKSMPSNTNGFKFGGAEIFGHIFARSKEMYDFFNHQTLSAALEDVCLKPGSWRARSFEEKLIELLGIRS